MAITFQLQKIIINSGDEVLIPDGGIVVIVGPNNVGKSTVLREISSVLASGGDPGTIIVSCEVQTTGTNDELRDWLVLVFEEAPNARFRIFRGANVEIRLDIAIQEWNNGCPTNYRQIINLFCHQTTGAGQQAAATNFASFNALEIGPQTPVQNMYAEEQVEKEMSDHFHRAFGIDLFVNRNAGNSIPIHCGDRPPLSRGEAPHSRTYMQRMKDVPTLADQGDGMKSFAGAIFTACSTHASVICFDEPDLHLHPPQARELGRFFSKHTPSSKQLIIATHNNSFIRGLLDSDTSRISIVRITRTGNKNHAHTLNHDELNEFWSDPILRYSDAINGIFHEKVIVCESDSDCHFYTALVSTLAEARNIADPGVLFVPSGGKHRIKTVVRALRALQVPTLAIVDIDILDNDTTLRALLEAFDVDWQCVAPLFARVSASFQQISPPQNANQVSQRIRDLLADITTTEFTSQNENEIRIAMRSTSPWRAAKRTGITHLRGNSLSEARQLIEQLATYGLHVLKIGEIERFVPTIGLHGPAWSAAALEFDLINDPALRDAREFVSSLVFT